MDQRRTVEITLFAALVTSQIALMALAASQVQKSSAHVTARFSGLVGLVLFMTYAAMVLPIEFLNRGDRAVYAAWESGTTAEMSSREFMSRSWAAWPVPSSALITVVLVWSTVLLGW